MQILVVECCGILSVVAVVSFEQSEYNVSEGRNLQVCVQVSNLSPNEDLAFGIDLIIKPRIGTAGKFEVIILTNLNSMAMLFVDGSDFCCDQSIDISISASGATETPMETCISTPGMSCATFTITDDAYYEADVECFGLDLLLNALVPQSRVDVDPNNTTICIKDNDSNDYNPPPPTLRVC